MSEIKTYRLYDKDERDAYETKYFFSDTKGSELVYSDEIYIKVLAEFKEKKAAI